MPEEEIVRMTATGWIFMGGSWLAITSLAVYCIAKIIKARSRVSADETPLE